MKPQHQQLASMRLTDDDADDGKRDWASLPLDLLRICLGAPHVKGDGEAKRAALASCKAFGSAVVRTSSHGLVSLLERRAKLKRTAKIWQELWGDEQPKKDQSVNLVIVSKGYASPARCLDELRSANQRMAFIVSLFLRSVSLDELLPRGLGAVMPSLVEVKLEDCVLTPAARTSLLDTGCTRLWHVDVQSLSVRTPAPPPTRKAASSSSQPPSNSNTLQQLATAQLRQLAKLPSLNTITLGAGSCPTLFLVALGAHLTCLQVHEAYRQFLPGTHTPTPAWRATLEHAARCTRLEHLAIPCATAEELRLVAPALQQLRMLGLKARSFQTMGCSLDAVLELLLGLPLLTNVGLHGFGWHTLRHSYVDRPCWWEEMIMPSVTCGQMGRLPLHSLKKPLTFWSLDASMGDSLREVRAAVANVTRRCPGGFYWEPNEDEPPRLVLPLLPGRDLDVPEALRALRPLLASLTSFEVGGGMRWDAGLVRVLGEVLPRTCTSLVLAQGGMSGEGLVQVARSLPWLRRLRSSQQEVAPEDAVAFVRLVRSLKAVLEGKGAVRLEEVVVEQPRPLREVGETELRRHWERAEQAMREVGGGVALTVKWA